MVTDGQAVAGGCCFRVSFGWCTDTATHCNKIPLRPDLWFWCCSLMLVSPALQCDCALAKHLWGLAVSTWSRLRGGLKYIYMTLSVCHWETWDIMKNTVLDASVQLTVSIFWPSPSASTEVKQKVTDSLPNHQLDLPLISQIHHLVHVFWKNTQNEPQHANNSGDSEV